jgi:pyruvate dehydrogenase E2 component (dihydrolipoamide acetyltransferase)
MITKFKMPKLTENDEEQTITEWFKREGESIRKGEPLVEITTSKAACELESPRGGVVRAILAAANSSLPIGYVIALIGDADDDLPDVSTSNRKLIRAHARMVPASPVKAVSSRGAETGALRATPAARRLARERGVDLALVQAGVRMDVITEAAVIRYLAEQNK